MSKYKRELIVELAKALHSYGYSVYLAKDKTYGFYTDGLRVVSFGGHWSFSVDYSGNYKSTRSGTGWQIEPEQGVPTAAKAKQYLESNAPRWAVGSDTITYTTPAQHLKTYGNSSGYALFNPDEKE